MKTAIKLLKEEKVPRIALKELDLISLSIIKNTEGYDPENDSDLKQVDIQNIEVPFLD